MIYLKSPNSEREFRTTATSTSTPNATLCLGSPLRLLWKLSRRPSLPGFASSCLVPYLYAVSHKLQFGGELLFRELKHGAEGIVEDYLDLFGLSNPEQQVDPRVIRRCQQNTQFSPS